MFIDAVEFIYNNFLILSVIVGSLAFSLLFFRQWYEEREMNRMLSVKKTMLRSLREAVQKRPSLTRSLIIGVPILFLAGFLYISFNPPLDYTHHVKRLDDADSFKEVRAAFYEKFYSSPLQNSSDMDDVEAMKRISNKKPDAFDGIDHVLKTEDYLYASTPHGIEVVYEDNDALSKRTTLLFPTPECERDGFTPEGLFNVGDSLVLIAQSTEGACDSDSPGLFDLERKTEVRVYDMDDNHTLKDTYEFSGLLSNAMFDGTTLFMSVNHYIGSDTLSEDVEHYLPSMSINDVESKPELSEIKYIDNTNPNNFMTVYAVDVAEMDVDYQVTLTDYRHHLDFVGDAAYMTTNSYAFDSTSFLFQLSDPIQSVNTIVSKFSLVSDSVHYSRTKKIEGSIAGDDSLGFYERSMFLVTENQAQDEQWIHHLDARLNTTASTGTDTHETVDRVFKHGDYLYLFSAGDGDPSTRIYDLGKASEIEYFDTHNGLGLIDAYEKDTLFDMVLGYEKNEDEVIMTMYGTTENGILNPTRSKTIEYEPLNLDLVADYPYENIQYDQNQNLLIFPIFSGVEDPLGSSSGRVLKGYDIYPNAGFEPASEVTFNHDGYYNTPFAYRCIKDDDHVYHVTPGGIVLSSVERPFEVLHRFDFFD